MWGGLSVEEISQLVSDVFRAFAGATLVLRPDGIAIVSASGDVAAVVAPEPHLVHINMQVLQSGL